MPRAPRYQAADVVYHVGSRGVEKRAIYDVVPRDREYFLGLLAEVIERYGWLCHSYCLMGNHFHLVVETPGANLSIGMQFLKGEYAAWFNAVGGTREGTLFERRFWSSYVRNDAYALALARYVALNPVRAGIVATPDQWPWSSYSATAGLSRAPRWLYTDGVLQFFGPTAGARTRFAQYVGEGIGDPAKAAKAVRDMEGSDPEG